MASKTRVVRVHGWQGTQVTLVGKNYKKTKSYLLGRFPKEKIWVWYMLHFYYVINIFYFQMCSSSILASIVKT
jgi:hypothetical protein